MIIETMPSKFCRIHSAQDMLKLYQAWENGEYRDVVGIYIYDDIYDYFVVEDRETVKQLGDYENKIMFIRNDIYTANGESSIRYGGEIVQIDTQTIT